MKQITVLSGKGGTGKTTVSGALIMLAENRAFADCDVDAPNLHLIFPDRTTVKKDSFQGYQKAFLYQTLCNNCGLCEEQCRFGAIRNGVVDRYACEGCGVCEYFCPVVDDLGCKAIRLEDNITGETEIGCVEETIFASGKLRIGNGASGKLVTAVRSGLTECLKNEQIVIIDGSPGIGCPVVASMTAVDMVLLVAEPTLSGLHDMKRIAVTAARMHVRCVVCINKYDINREITEMIEEYCNCSMLTIVGMIPYDPVVPIVINSGRGIMKMENCAAAKAISDIWENILKILN